jgi:dihydrofolate reductase
VSGEAGRQSAGPIALVLVAAVGENGVIGRNGGLPWRLKSDMQHFRKLTMGRPVVMGRKTYESIGKPLKERTNIAISRDPAYAAPGILVAPSLQAALAVARADALRRSADAIAIIGGAGIFRDTMSMADRLEITVVHACPEGDTFFPPIDAKVWQETARLRHPATPQDDAEVSFIIYERWRPTAHRAERAL